MLAVSDCSQSRVEYFSLSCVGGCGGSAGGRDVDAGAVEACAVV